MAEIKPKKLYEDIWNLLMNSIQNPYGVAAVMGNLYTESSLNTKCMTGKAAKSYESADQYIQMVNDGRIEKDIFAHDGIAFGLVQWLFWSRKESLHTYAEGKDISDWRVQIGFMIQEVSNHYKTVWKILQSASTIDEASDSFMLRYEKPGTTTEAAKARRRTYAGSFYALYAMDDILAEPEPAVREKRVRTIADKVVFRSGNGKEYNSLGRIEAQGTSYPWVATAENGWHAIVIGKQVVWISGEFSEVIFA